MTLSQAGFKSVSEASTSAPSGTVVLDMGMGGMLVVPGGDMLLVAAFLTLSLRAVVANHGGLTIHTGLADFQPSTLCPNLTLGKSRSTHKLKPVVLS